MVNFVAYLKFNGIKPSFSGVKLSVSAGASVNSSFTIVLKKLELSKISSSPLPPSSGVVVAGRNDQKVITILNFLEARCFNFLVQSSPHHVLTISIQYYQKNNSSVNFELFFLKIFKLQVHILPETGSKFKFHNRFGKFVNN